jgi:hypothetical protein
VKDEKIKIHSTTVARQDYVTSCLRMESVQTSYVPSNAVLSAVRQGATRDLEICNLVIKSSSGYTDCIENVFVIIIIITKTIIKMMIINHMSVETSHIHRQFINIIL